MRSAKIHVKQTGRIVTTSSQQFGYTSFEVSVSRQRAVRPGRRQALPQPAPNIIRPPRGGEGPPPGRGGGLGEGRRAGPPSGANGTSGSSSCGTKLSRIHEDS